MKSFIDMDTLVGAVPFEVVEKLRTADIGRGCEALCRDKFPEVVKSLADRARVAGIEASSAIEGVVVEDRARVADIVSGKADRLCTRSEQELAGYRSVVDYLYQEQWRPLSVGLLLHLHRLLYQYTQVPGGQLMQTENLVVDQLPDGTKIERFTPVSVAQTPYYLGDLISRYLTAQQEGRHHPVIVTGLFTLDLLTIHPFIDGNGSITRALTNALLQDAGYDVTRYVPLETSIARSDRAYGAFLESTRGWNDGQHDPWPWLRYFVGLVAGSYDQFAELTAHARAGGSKQDRVRGYVVNQANTTFQIADIRAALPGVSDQTIRLALNQLKVTGRVKADRAGRGATWTSHLTP